MLIKGSCCSILVVFLIAISVSSLRVEMPDAFVDKFCGKVIEESTMPYHEEDLEQFNKQSGNYRFSIVHPYVTSTEQTYFRYHSDEIYPVSRYYTWLTDHEYETDEEIRENMAILEDWNTLDYVSEFRIPAGVEMGVGIVGPQEDDDEEYKGGAFQALVNSKYILPEYVVRTTKRQH